MVEKTVVVVHRHAVVRRPVAVHRRVVRSNFARALPPMKHLKMGTASNPAVPAMIKCIGYETI